MTWLLYTGITLYHRPHLIAQKMGRNCLMNNRQLLDLTRGSEDRLVVRGCLFSSCSLTPSHPTHHLSHLQKQAGLL